MTDMTTADGSGRKTFFGHPRGLVVLFVASALYFVAIEGGQWLRAGLSLLPATDAAAASNWGLALGACLCATWAFGRLRDGHGHAMR